MLHDRRASNIVEWIVGVSLFILIAAPVVYELYTAIQAKLEAIHADIH